MPRIRRSTLLTILQDLVSLGIALGVDQVGELIEEEKDLAHAIARINRSKDFEDLTEDVRDAADKVLAGAAPIESYYSAMDKEAREAAKLQIRQKFVLRMRSYLIEHVIRRTAESKRPDGKQLSGLPPPVIVHIRADMGREERKEFEAVARAIGQQ